MTRQGYQNKAILSLWNPRDLPYSKSVGGIDQLRSESLDLDLESLCSNVYGLNFVDLKIVEKIIFKVILKLGSLSIISGSNIPETSITMITLGAF